MCKKIFGLVACAMLAFGLTACSSPKEEGPDYADDEAMEVIASGYEKRSDVIEGQEIPEDDAAQKKNYIEAVEAELSVTGELKDRQFDDSKLQEKVVAYINTLNDSLDVLDSYAISDFEFWDAWQKVYDERTSILKDFVDSYDLEVGEKYQDSFPSWSRMVRLRLRGPRQKTRLTALCPLRHGRRSTRAMAATITLP